ncbi:DUF7064 domain-containing protein [Flavisphingomonas formosensis]|uniref:DUF7064 domain-containing protein n=1 Tax=Flavisphingomonas formosensis TaxID=861534 RepID=UPI0012FBA9E2|nr:hypothetical protein [Sphingomonas formosensis]
MLGEDERLHPVGAGDDWFESWWFAFYVPERLLTVYVYPWFRPNLGLCGGGVIAWDERGIESRAIVHHDYAWSLRFGGADTIVEGDAIVTPQGIRIDCLAPAERYRLRYERPGLAFDVEFEASGGASRINTLVAEADIFKGHIDQPGRYRGWVRVGDDRHVVDCHCVRDRSWGPRGDDATGMHIGYYHATASDKDAFLIFTHAGEDGDSSTMISGYLIRDGIQAQLAEGRARITRGSDLSPATCVIDATDREGRVLHAEGRGLTSVALLVQPGMFNWSSLAEWRFGEAFAYGELQDTWHPDAYRVFARARGVR